jgi:hypothetical protein
MKIEIVKDNIQLTPETRAETHQLEWVKQRIEEEGMAWDEMRQWEILRLTVYTKPCSSPTNSGLSDGGTA